MTFTEAVVRETEKQLKSNKVGLERTDSYIAKFATDIAMGVARAACEATLIDPPSKQELKDEPYSSSVVERCRVEQLAKAVEFFGGII